MQFLKHITISLILVALATTAARAVEMNSVLVRYCPKSDFQYISEYFSGKETYTDRVVVRTDAKQRAGVYWIIRFKEALSVLPKESVLFLQYIPTGSTEVYTEVFPLPTNVGQRKLVYAGITDQAWAKKDAHPTAWKLTLKDQQGNELASSQSYLWQMPELDSSGQ